MALTGLAACSSERDADNCLDGESVAIPISMPRWNPDASVEQTFEAELGGALERVDSLAMTEWIGSRSELGHARLGCWYDREPDVIGDIVATSLASGRRSTADWLAVASSARHEAAKAAILAVLLIEDPTAALPLWIAMMSGDGRGLHVSALKTLAFGDSPAVMAAVIEAINVSGYPSDGLMGAPFEHDLPSWASAQRSRYWSVVWPTYWLLGLGAPDDTSALDRIREVHSVGAELKATEQYIDTLRQLKTLQANLEESDP
jgi:hypothetical protein